MIVSCLAEICHCALYLIKEMAEKKNIIARGSFSRCAILCSTTVFNQFPQTVKMRIHNGGKDTPKITTVPNHSISIYHQITPLLDFL